MIGAITSTVAALALVTGLLLVGARLWLRYAPRVAGQGADRLRVVARLGVAPRQGIVIVRVGDRGLVLGMAENGLRTLAELDAREMAQFDGDISETLPHPASFAAQIGALRPEFRSALRRARSAMLVLLAIGALFAFGAAGAAAQSAAATKPVPVDSIASALLPPLSLALGNKDDGLRLSGTVGTVAMLGLMVTLPTLLLLMTSFTRILVVLHLLRQALGTQNAPPGHLLAALALLLTALVMAPTITEINQVALRPWVDGTINEGAMMKNAVGPLRVFMLENTGERELETFLELADVPAEVTEEQVPTVVLMSAFATSELRAAFQMGFAIFLPFIVVDLVVAAVLTSMGMFMLPPTMIALPCKLMLFVLVDGWGLVVRGLVQSFA